MIQLKSEEIQFFKDLKIQLQMLKSEAENVELQTDLIHHKMNNYWLTLFLKYKLDPSQYVIDTENGCFKEKELKVEKKEETENGSQQIS